MAYLWAHFTGESPEGEQVYFSVSRDGLNWTDLCEGAALRSSVGEMGVRDPFLIHNPVDGRYHLIATDLRIASGKGWDTAQFAGSTAIIEWSSADLMRWDGPHRVELPGLRERGAGCAWAPEAFFDKERGACLMYWASMIERRQRIFAAWTRDFRSFEDVHQMIEKRGHIIDVTMAEEDGAFYRFSACADAEGILMERGNALCAGDFAPCYPSGVPGTQGSEGPIILYLKERHAWCLYVDHIRQNAGCIPYLSETLASPAFRRAETFDFGARKKRHGGIIAIPDEAYERLISFYGAAQVL